MDEANFTKYNLASFPPRTRRNGFTRMSNNKDNSTVEELCPLILVLDSRPSIMELTSYSSASMDTKSIMIVA